DSFDYDTRSRRVVAVNHTTTDSVVVIVFDPDTLTWTELPASTPVPHQSGGMMGSAMLWRYVPSLNAFVFLAGDRGATAGGSSQTWAYRYQNLSSASDFALRCAQPGVVRCEGFDTPLAP